MTVLFILVVLTVLAVLFILVLLTVLTVPSSLPRNFLPCRQSRYCLHCENCPQPRLWWAIGPSGSGVPVFQRLVLIQSEPYLFSTSVSFCNKAPEDFVPISSQSETTLPTVGNLVRLPYPEQQNEKQCEAAVQNNENYLTSYWIYFRSAWSRNGCNVRGTLPGTPYTTLQRITRYLKLGLSVFRAFLMLQTSQENFD